VCVCGVKVLYVRAGGVVQSGVVGVCSGVSALSAEPGRCVNQEPVWCGNQVQWLYAAEQ